MAQLAERIPSNGRDPQFESGHRRVLQGQVKKMKWWKKIRFTKEIGVRKSLFKKSRKFTSFYLATLNS